MPETPDNLSQTFGQRVRHHRERLGKTRPVLAGLVGRSTEWVKSIENDRLHMPRLPMLLRLAEALEVEELSELTGDARLVRGVYAKNIHDSLKIIQDAMVSYWVTQGDSVSVDDFTVRVDGAWRAWHTSHCERAAIAPMLPRLIADGRASQHAADDSNKRRGFARQLARVYHLAQLYCSFQPAPELVYMTSDRSMLTAQDADDPASLAGAAWYMNHVWRDAGEAAEARVELALDVADMLRPDSSPEHRALYALMQLAVALSHAKTGKAGDAWRHHDEAYRAARSLDGYNHPWLMIGSGMVEHYVVTMHLDLQQPGKALDAARNIDPAAIPSRTRQSRYLVEVARAHYRQHDRDAAVYQMLKARGRSHDTFEFSLFARSMVTEMLAHPTATIADDVRDLGRTLELSV
ncbi:helix-turn-helix domain-containing protein [Streptomyces boncukensis]|uniref:Helix-turn-helix domain-containing protein n=1 Tax=Streptomyces boncukensis TaxID=2711219 RepID=A0A6G4X615_9ACTN|nr:helix-turn-helix transcriptional regulator [Streptomyces boncukensis]NGO72838.1 helix-turn-helix domain-containing protein [Streptomyces boncukensis]